MSKRKTDRQKMFEKSYGKLFKAFMEVEARAFNESRERFILKVTTKKVKQFILDNCFQYVTIKTLTNLGQLSCSLTLDMYAKDNEIPSTMSRIDVQIILCNCGTNFSAEDKNGKALYTSKCHEEYRKWRKAGH